DVILKMGTKQVLYDTRHLGWGTDVQLYRTAAALRQALPERLRLSGARVLKQQRGNGGNGVWKFELLGGTPESDAIVRVLHAQRGSTPGRAAAGRIPRALRGVLHR